MSGKYVKGPFDVEKLPKWSGLLGVRRVCRRLCWEVDEVVRFRVGGRGSGNGNGNGNANGWNGVSANLDILVGPVCGDVDVDVCGGGEERSGLNQSVDMRSNQISVVERNEEEEAEGEEEETALLSTWMKVPVPYVMLKNIVVDLRLQSYRAGLFTSTVYNGTDRHQLSGTIVRYFFELFCGMLGVDGSTRIQPERKWETLEVRLWTDEYENSHVCEDDVDRAQAEGTILDNQQAIVGVRRSQCKRWRIEAGNELKYLFNIIQETGILHGRLKTLRFSDGQSTSEWQIQKVESFDGPNEGISTNLAFTDLSKVWLALGCEEMV